MTNGYNSRLRTGLGLQQATGEWTNGFAYDAAGRLTGVTSPAGTFGYYYRSGIQRLVAGISLPNLSFITNFFDTEGRLTGTYLETSAYTILDSASGSYLSDFRPLSFPSLTVRCRFPDAFLTDVFAEFAHFSQALTG